MEWREAVSSLVAEVGGWISEAGLGAIDASSSPVADAPVLAIEIPGRATFFLEPAMFAADRVPTIVNLYAYPSMRRVQLEGPKAGAWEVRTTNGIAMNYRWNSHDFLKLLTELADEPVPGCV